MRACTRRNMLACTRTNMRACTRRNMRACTRTNMRACTRRNMRACNTQGAYHKQHASGMSPFRSHMNACTKICTDILSMFNPRYIHEILSLTTRMPKCMHACAYTASRSPRCAAA
eukprot:356843-Chlamydomonas_euryale.AAC.4